MKHLLFIFLTLLLLFSCQSDLTVKQEDDNDIVAEIIPEVVEDDRVLVWSDEFDGTTLNLNNWSFELGDGCPNLCGWGNNELQSYTDSNHRLEDGMLIISAKNENEYTSTRILTKGKQEFTYGKIETRVKVPSGAGLWPAFWALGGDIDTNSWPDCGEIDIMEYVGKNPGQIFTSVHTRSSYGNTVNTQITPVPNIEDDFHVFAIDWTENYIDFYLDESRVYRYAAQTQTAETWPFNKPFFLLINLAIGGNFGGPVASSVQFPKEYLIDYVRVYQ